MTKHVATRASENLRAECSQACISLGRLVAAAAEAPAGRPEEVGMDRFEVHRALLFLHTTGSVLHYATDTLRNTDSAIEYDVTRRGSHALQDTVFMQPQFIINAIKYVIREPCATDVNDEIRTLDARIRQDPENAKELDDFLGIGTVQAHGAGVLTRQLLKHLWQRLDLNLQHHTVLLDLMKAFKLLRPLADKDKFLVPAMLPQCALPDEYVKPDWWRPSTVGAVAMMHVEDEVRRGEMRIMYKVLGGHLPFGFISELQVRLAQTQECLHFAPEAAVVERIAGSVLKLAYRCGGGKIRESVILSQPLALTKQEQQGKPGKVRVTADCICIMGWVELLSKPIFDNNSKPTVDNNCLGATDWRVFRMVMNEIEAMWKEAPGLSLRKLVFFVDTSGQVLKPLDITNRLLATVDPSKLFTFKFDDDSKDPEDVDPDLVLPSLSEIKLSMSNQSSQPPAVSEGTRMSPEHKPIRVILGFFAKKRTEALGVHGEAQEIHNLFSDERGRDFEFRHNPEPTFQMFSDQMLSVKRRNVRIVHFSGHGSTKDGLSWFKNTAATSAAMDSEKISTHSFTQLFEPVAALSAEGGTVECVFLNACESETVGEGLRECGVPYVVCWRTVVQDASAVLFARDFYAALDHEPQDYRLAFIQATKRMHQIRGAQGSLDVVCFLSKDGPTEVHAAQSVSSGPMQTLSTHTTLYPSSNRSDPAGPEFLKVHLNQFVTQGLSDLECHALARDLAAWAPGPILFQQGDEVKLVPKKMEHTLSKNGTKLFTFPEHTNKKGTVVAHSKETPLTVTVRLEGGVSTDAEDVNVLYSILMPQNVSAESSVARTKRMLATAHELETRLDANAAAVNAATIIGYSESMRADRLEREYWITFSPLSPLLGQQLLNAFSAKEHTLDLCVMHVQYTSLSADPSNVQRASLRLTTSVAPKAYQDKCRACEECEARRQCADCQQFVGKFTKSDGCTMHRNCDHCPEFKWADTYGVLSPPLAGSDGLSLDGLKRILEKCGSKCDASNMMSPYPIDDFGCRRFAFIVGNDSYANVEPLSNCIAGAKAIAVAVKALGFLVHKDAPLENQKTEELKDEFIAWTKMLPENAVVFIYVAGHGMELQDRYLLPIDFEFEEDHFLNPKNFEQHLGDVSEEVDENFVLFERNVKRRSLSLRWMQARLNVSLRCNGLHMVFWDCCRENVPEYEGQPVLVRIGTPISGQALPISEQEFNEEWEKWLVNANVLEEQGALNGGHCEDYMVALSSLQVEGERLLSRFIALEPLLLRGTAENASMISGLDAKKMVLSQMSPSNLPGKFTLFAPAVSCLAQDGAAGEYSPFVGALLSWFGNVTLVKCDVLDLAVRCHVNCMVQIASKLQQQPEWNHSGKIAFRFSEEQ